MVTLLYLYHFKPEYYWAGVRSPQIFRKWDLAGAAVELFISFEAGLMTTDGVQRVLIGVRNEPNRVPPIFLSPFRL